jgi:hypothetical protein
MGIELIGRTIIFNDTQANVEAETGALAELCFGRDTATGGLGYTIDGGITWVWLPVTAGGGDVYGASTGVTDGDVVGFDADGYHLKSLGSFPSGLGDVKGPVASMIGQVATFADILGKTIQDGGKLLSDLVSGPAVSVAGNVMTFADTTGKNAADGGWAYTPPTAYTPVAVGLTTPVYATQTGYWAKIGTIVICWGRLDITSWAGQTGYIRTTLPVNASITTTLGQGQYYRSGGSAVNPISNSNILNATTLGFGKNDASDDINWEASARVVLSWSIMYMG